GVVGKRDESVFHDRRVFRERAVTGDAGAVAEEPRLATAGAVDDRLRAWDVRQRRMASVEAARGDVEVERVERDRTYACGRTAVGRPWVRRFVDPRRSADLVNARRPHGVRG